MSNTKNSIRRSVKSSQLHMREIVLFLDQATDTLTGPDQLLVATLTDLGAGNHQIDVNTKAAATYGKDFFLKGFSSETADVNVQVTAKTSSSITIQSFVAGVAADANVVLTIGAHDWKIEYKA